MWWVPACSFSWLHRLCINGVRPCHDICTSVYYKWAACTVLAVGWTALDDCQHRRFTSCHGLMDTSFGVWVYTHIRTSWYSRGLNWMVSPQLFTGAAVNTGNGTWLLCLHPIWYEFNVFPVMHACLGSPPLEAEVIRFGRDNNKSKTACQPVGDPVSVCTNPTLLAVG